MDRSNEMLTGIIFLTMFALAIWALAIWATVGVVLFGVFEATLYLYPPAVEYIGDPIETAKWMSGLIMGIWVARKYLNR